MNDQTLLYPLLFEPNLHTVVWGGEQHLPNKTQRLEGFFGHKNLQIFGSCAGSKSISCLLLVCPDM